MVLIALSRTDRIPRLTATLNGNRTVLIGLSFSLNTDISNDGSNYVLTRDGHGGGSVFNESLTGSDVISDITTNDSGHITSLGVRSLVPVDIGAEPAITSYGTAFNSDFGTTSGTVSEGDHNHDDSYYTETEVNDLFSDKSDTTHIHDDSYFQESELNPGTTGGLETNVTDVTWGTTGTKDLSGVLINDAAGTTTTNKNDASETDTRYYTKEDVAIIIDNVLQDIANKLYSATSGSIAITLTNPINNKQINYSGYII